MTDNYKASLAVIELLTEQYPACFQVYGARRRPLKIGINADAVAALNGVATVQEIGNALRVYTANFCYLRACTHAGAARIDLAGNTAGHVTIDEARHARERLNRQSAKWKRRQESEAKAKAEAERKERNKGRLSLRDLREMAKARREQKSAAA
jgi:sRNA-binding protein